MLPSDTLPSAASDDYGSGVGHGHVGPQLGAVEVTGGTQSDGTTVDIGTASGVIEVPGDEDWFGVTLTEGETYQLEVLGATNGGGDLADPVLTVYDAHGTMVAQDDDFETTGPDGSPVVDLDPLLGFTAPTTGTYFLGASAYGEAAGSYTVSVLGDPGTVAPPYLLDVPSG